ncbi:MAG: hypothetical protein AB7T63_10755 [Planctomycetota bacterium]
MGPAEGLLIWAIVFASVVVHEAGHALAARWRDLPVLGVYFSWIPFVGIGPGPHRARAVAALAGPAASLLAAGVLAFWPAAREQLVPGAQHLWLGKPAGLALGFNLLAAGVNLLPFRPLDGGLALHAALASWRGDAPAARTMRILGAVGALAAGALAVAVGGELGLTIGLLAAVLALAAFGTRVPNAEAAASG